MSLREKRQAEFASVMLEHRKLILVLAPRFGKIRTTILALKQMKNVQEILVLYPDNKIKVSWEEDMDKWEYVNENVTFLNYSSLSKVGRKKFDVVVMDEIHAMSPNQLSEAQSLVYKTSFVIGLTGTLNQWNEIKLKEELSLEVMATYDTETAIAEGVITDYEINVVKVPLDNKILQTYKDKQKTEKKQYDAYSWVINKLVSERKDTFALRLTRMRIIQNSVAKLQMTKRILKKYEEERILVFGGNILSIEKLGISTYHSKSVNDTSYNDFLSGKTSHLAVVNIGSMGVTYKSLSKVVINYFSSSDEDLMQKIFRCMALEYDNPEKKAKIYIVTTSEKVELLWLNKALSQLNPEKINYLN